jgi:GNAT superfamily N-acetyltransferase
MIRGVLHFACVDENEEGVIGFIFGRSSNKKAFYHQYGGLLGQFRFAIKFIFSVGGSLSTCVKLISSMKSHERNRKNVFANRKHEVHLFCVSRKAQGRGTGKNLMNSFLDDCKKNGVTIVSLDTDKKYCNFGFYEHFGYKLVGYFRSPIQLFYSGTSDECCTYKIHIEDQPNQSS